jgi:hypothetical protein
MRDSLCHWPRNDVVGEWPRIGQIDHFAIEYLVERYRAA